MAHGDGGCVPASSAVSGPASKRGRIRWVSDQGYRGAGRVILATGRRTAGRILAVGQRYGPGSRSSYGQTERNVGFVEGRGATARRAHGDGGCVPASSAVPGPASKRGRIRWVSDQGYRGADRVILTAGRRTARCIAAIIQRYRSGPGASDFETERNVGVEPRRAAPRGSQRYGGG